MNDLKYYRCIHCYSGVSTKQDPKKCKCGFDFKSMQCTLEQYIEFIGSKLSQIKGHEK